MIKSKKQNTIFFLIIAILLCLPPFFEGGNSPYILSVVFILVSILIIIFSLNLDKKEDISIKWYKNPIFYFGLFLIFIFISNFFSHNIYFSWLYFLQYLMFFALFFIISKYSFSQNSVKFLFYSFLAVSLLLCLVGIFFYTGYSLIKDSVFISTSGISGSLLLCIGFILSMILFIDYRYKEQSEHIIKQQGKAIDNLGKSLKNTSETHSRIEKTIQAEFSSSENKIGKDGGKQYSLESNSETSNQ